MKNELNTNNSKKLIIGISIFFCAVIIIVGATTAYFTQSGIGETGNVVSTDQVTLHYDDNDDYMLGELIPINEDDLETAYNNKCKDNRGYNVCSIYQFTITNTGNVVQDIIINMHPKANGFTNLKFNLYDITKGEQIVFNKELILNSEEPINLENDLTLDTSDNKSNTYELVFYIKNDPYNDQTDLDAGKRFGANIKVSSVTTGKYILEELGDPGCWKADDNDPTIISEFIGYTDKNENKKFDESDELKTECANYFKKDEDNYYIVNVPSEYVGYNFTKVGNNLLTGFDLDENGQPSTPNEYSKIKSLTLNDNITTIGETGDEAVSPSFAGLGFGVEDPGYSLEVQLPANLITIGNASFAISKITLINIPEKVKTIGDSSFINCNITTDDNYSLVIPESVTYIGAAAFDSNFNLTKLVFNGLNTEVTNENKLTIRTQAFTYCGLDYRRADKPLELPARLTFVDTDLFCANGHCNINLHFIRYHGTKETLNTFGNNGLGWADNTKYVKTAEEYNVEEAKNYETTE